MKKYLNFIIVIYMTILSAEEIDVSQPLRIIQLMPRDTLTETLAIEPFLPENYIALSMSGKIDY